MSNSLRLLVIVGLAAAIAVVLFAKQRASISPGDPTELADGEASQINPDRAIPKLVDLGADKCIPCKQMAPILESLKKEYAGRMQVEFIDVWKNPEAGALYKINLIPTQIFFDADGKELFRHEGFYSRENILNKWKELGVDIHSSPVSG